MKLLRERFLCIGFWMSVLLIFTLYSCQKNDLNSSTYGDLFWIKSNGANMPVMVEGNSKSNVFIITLHGGPGGSSRIFNDVMTEISIPLEEDFVMVYYDQRAAGNTLGTYDYESINIEQMVDDLDLLIEVLFDKYGSDISLFLLGHSWGGYLGTSYLKDGNLKESLSGWIDVDGAHNFGFMINRSLEKMIELAEARIKGNSVNVSKWEDILEFAQQAISEKTNKDLFLKVNSYARKTEDLLEEEEIIYKPKITSKEYLSIFLKDHNWINAAANVLAGYKKTTLMDKALENPLSEFLPDIQTPSIFIWGEYDIIVPVDLAEEAYEVIGSQEKHLVIFEHSGHSPMESEPVKFVDTVKEFVELYK